jgi:glycosyltransferase involved in cell wall biosynthesis
MKEEILVIGQLPPPYHGSTAMTEMFCNSLSMIGYSVNIVNKTFSKKMQDVERISIKKILIVPFIAGKILIKLIVKRPSTCFYLPSVKPPSLYVDWLFLGILHLFKSDIILYLHGKGYERIYRKEIKISQWLMEKIFSKCSGAFVLGNLLKDDFKRFIPVENMAVLPNCTTDSKYIKKYIESVDNKKIIKILFLSNLVITKGPMEFLKLAKQISKIDDNVKFFLAGSMSTETDLITNIKKFVIDNKLKHTVKILGGVYGEIKEKLFMESDIFIFPTYYDLETFGLVNIEAMRAGLPVISTNEGSIPEVVIDGLNGFIVDLKDPKALYKKTKNLIKDENLRIKMGKSSRAIFQERFTLSAYRQNLIKALCILKNRKVNY